MAQDRHRPGTHPMEAVIYAKTELGMREVKERTLKLPVPIRGLLIMIDGNRTVADVMDKARVLRVDQTALELLESEGLIARKSGARATAPEVVEAPRSEDDVERFLRAQQIMSDATNAHMGFRGYGMMMRLQKTSTLQDLRQLLPDFAAALVKRAGTDVAGPILTEIDGLLKSA
jgi:hypothetical protein